MMTLAEIAESAVRSLDNIDDDMLTNAAIQWLKDRGYSITLPLLWRDITPADLARMVGRQVSSVSRCLSRPDCPPYRATCGPTGRILTLRPSAELITWLSERRRPSTRRAPAETYESLHPSIPSDVTVLSD